MVARTQAFAEVKKRKKTFGPPRSRPRDHQSGRGDERLLRGVSELENRTRTLEAEGKARLRFSHQVGLGLLLSHCVHNTMDGDRERERETAGGVAREKTFWGGSPLRQD